VLREERPRLLEHASPVVRRRALTLPSPPVASPAMGDRHPEPIDTDAEAPRRGLAARLDDPDPDVREAAYRSLALSAGRESVPLLVGRLAWPQHRAFAREVLVALGGRIVGALGDDLADPGTPARVRREIPRVLADIGGQHAAHGLLRAAG